MLVILLIYKKYKNRGGKYCELFKNAWEIKD